MLNAVLAALCWWLYVRTKRTDPRQLRMAWWFLLACWFTVLAATEVAFYFLPIVAALLAVVLLAPFSVFVLAGILLSNGLQMFRKEGRSLGNSLAGLLGLALVVLPVAGVAGLLLTRNQGFGIWLGFALLFLYGAAQLGISFLVFWTFAKLYARIPPRPHPDAVVVLGSGLMAGGQVPQLLANRLDRGRAAYDAALAGTLSGPRIAALGDPARTLPTSRALPTPSGSADLISSSGMGNEAGNERHESQVGREGSQQLFMIPSGGKGSDEQRSESSAMAEYLVEQGMNPANLVLEENSANTEQNLIFSRAAADQAKLAHADHSASRQLLVVTNGYHVPRAALLSRQVNVDADVVGAPTARYFVPSAFIREFIAVVKMHWKLQLGIAVPGVLAGLAIIVMAIFQF
ncbi:YdcF family protein [Propionimicrobium sp. PCR01-08-3]|uniref:YdcF family protein n=1 Tax=Propionimicrobium sp. PCR01-08-3 TaxID=3052086 RepID=UPI00255C3F48|nr:YdcF family protein [Propionimicrobium sp. PCR01-08-3]WIY82400.1 YdcF family protein [Propionimicrobium sp. PCR01-08-3]